MIFQSNKVGIKIKKCANKSFSNTQSRKKLTHYFPAEPYAN